MARVNRAMQVSVPSGQSASGDGYDNLQSPAPHIFAVGDVADGFGAVNLARSARSQVRPLYRIECSPGLMRTCAG